MSEVTSIFCESREAWERWLEEHHETADEVWVRLAKVGSGIPSLRPDEAIEVCLCFGWIDGLRRSLDEQHYLQRYTPRRARSRWSRVNREKAIELLELGLVRPAGLREIERAKADGRWDAAYEPASSATVPADLQAALDAEPAAATAFAGLDARNRYAILHRVEEAKRPETRARRIAKFVAMLAAGERLYP